MNTYGGRDGNADSLIREYRWIAVTDELPPAWLRVLTARFDPDCADKPVIEIAETGYGASGWRDDKGREITGVTHWADLPDPPSPERMRKVAAVVFGANE